MKEQYIEIQGIPSDIGDDSQEDKVIEMLAEAHIVATKSDIEDCHSTGAGWVRMVVPLYNLSIENFVMSFWKKN